MLNGRSGNVIRGIIYGGCSRIILIVAPFLLKTVIIYTLGIEYVGLDSLFSSVLQMLNLAELGIGSALIYSMYKPISDKNIYEVNALLNFYKKCYRVIGILVLLFGSCLFPFLDRIIRNDIPKDLNIHILYTIVLADTVIGYFLFAYKKSLLLANQRVDIINKINAIINILKYFIQIILLMYIRNFYIFYSIRIFFTALENIISAIYVARYYPQYSAIGKIPYQFLTQLKKKIAGLVLSKFGNIILISADSIVISFYLGLTVLGQYNLYFSIINSATSMIAILSFAFLPSVGNCLVQESKEKNYEIFRTINFLYTWIVICFSAMMFSLYQPFMRIWVGEERMLDDAIIIFFVLFFYIYKSRESILLYYDADGLWWEGKYIQVLSSMFNLIINIIMVQYIGLYGILLSTILAISIFDIPLIARTVFKNCFNIEGGLADYFLTQFKEFLKMVIVVLCTHLVCNVVLQKQTNLLFIIRILICMLLPHLLLFILNRKSKDFIETKRYLKNRLRGKYETIY